MSDSTGSAASSAFPRSGYDRTGGLVYFARMLDKIRLHATGRLPADYHGSLGAGLDGRCCRLLKVEYDALRQRALAGGADEEILQWCFKEGREPTDEEIMIWNCFARKRGWRDEEDGATAALEKYKAGSALAHRTDIVTMFDYHEADEGREPEEKRRARVTGVAPVFLVKDLMKSAAYWCDVLGFTVDRFWGEPANFCMPKRNGLIVMLSELPAGHSATPVWQIVDKMWNAYFWVDDVKSLYAEFQKSGAIIDYTLCMQPYSVLEFGIQDIDGNDIGFGQPV